jgi:2-C-methyl-D-erythritol 4-phosphate cytidylyltransferase
VGAVVVGAGSGQRFGGVEKAFYPVAGRPLLSWSVEVFERSGLVDRVCLVVAAGSVARAEGLVRELGWRKVAVVAGGRERQDSVGAGLATLADCAWVLVHDAARPLVTEAIVEAGLAAARRHGAAVAATPVRDTLKRVDPGSGLVRETVERAGLWAAQTPQVFRASLLREAFQLAGARAGSYTDDAALVAAAGYPVAVFPGAAENLKLTVPEDVAPAVALLRARGRA